MSGDRGERVTLTDGRTLEDDQQIRVVQPLDLVRRRCRSAARLLLLLLLRVGRRRRVKLCKRSKDVARLELFRKVGEGEDAGNASGAVGGEVGGGRGDGGDRRVPGARRATAFKRRRA
jgi:hypothetical protein